ncbi:MAG: LLM class flavin-dependent oxidoreductase [Actinomycetota bacterium]
MVALFKRRRDDRLRIGFQDPTRPPHRLSQIVARLADRVRFDSYWFLDHFMGVVPPGMWSADLTAAARVIRSPDEFFDPFVVVGAIGAHTKRVRLGISVTDTVRLHPAWIARAALTLQHTTKGRFILGLGAGERENLEPYGLNAEHLAPRCEESIKVIRLLWGSSGPIDFEGTFFTLRGASLALRPYLQRPPPIWLAAMGPRMLGITGRYADGWLPHWQSLDRYRTSLEIIRASAKQAGRDANAVTPGLVFTCVLDNKHDDCHSAMESPALKLAALLHDAVAWRDAGSTHPFGEEFRGMVDFVPTRVSPESIRAAMDTVPWQIVHTLFPHGTPEELAEKVRAYQHAGLRHVIFENIAAVGKPAKAISSFTALGKTARILRREDPGIQ